MANPTDPMPTGLSDRELRLVRSLADAAKLARSCRRDDVARQLIGLRRIVVERTD